MNRQGLGGERTNSQLKIQSQKKSLIDMGIVIGSLADNKGGINLTPEFITLRIDLCNIRNIMICTIDEIRDL